MTFFNFEYFADFFVKPNEFCFYKSIIFFLFLVFGIMIRQKTTGMKNIKCYGRQKTIVPKEKSFIKNFFDGNESSEIFDKSFENKIQAVNHCENKENVYSIFQSPVLFDEDLATEQKSTAKPKQAAKHKPRYVKKYRQCKRNVKGIQHLSTKYCKSQQPCWDKFEKYDLTIERPEINNQHIFNVQCKNSEKLKNVKYPDRPPGSLNNNTEDKNVNQAITLCHMTPSKIECVQTKLYASPGNSIESSGELFIKIPSKKSSKKSSMKTIRKTPRIKKPYSKLSHNVVSELEGKMIQCMQSVDFCKTSDDNINCSNSEENISNTIKVLSGNCALPRQNIMHNQSSPSVSDLLADNIPERKLVSDTVEEVFRDFANQNSVAATKTDICFNNEFSKSLIFKNTDSKTENFEVTQHLKCKSSQFVNNSAKSNSNYCNDNLSSSKLNDLKKGENFCLDMPKNATLDKSNIEIALNKSQNISTNTIILFPEISNALCNLNAENISSKPVNKNDQDCIHSKDPETMKTQISISKLSHDFPKSSAILCDKNVDSSNTGKKCFKSSICKGNKLDIQSFSPNVSNIFQSFNTLKTKHKGKYVTSTPVTSKRKHLHCINAETIVLSDNEISELKACSKEGTSVSKKINANKCKKPIKMKHLKDSSINSLNKSESVENQKSLLHGMTSNVFKSRKSLTAPFKSSILSVSPKPCQSLLNLSSTNPLTEDRKSEQLFTKADLLELCNQDSVALFADIYNWKNFKVKKIGEGTYGEVFQLSKGKTSSVLKVIAVSEDPKVKNLQGLSSAYSEVKISKSLSELRHNQVNQSKNFVKINRSSVVTGSYPAVLMKAWDDFTVDTSTYNVRPDIYSEDQLYVILELEYGGKDMSTLMLRNSVEAEIILKQIAVSLAVAESEFSFEHRDLHLGNILIKRNRSKNVSYKIQGKDISFSCLGLQISIIDFTLSTLSEKNYIYYHNLADDESLFDQSGEEHHAVYKSMRKHLENKWEEASLYSNVLWLKYLCKIMKESKYTHPNAVTHKRGLKAIDSFKSQLMKCDSALECLQKCGITKTAFQKIILGTPRNSILVSRNSIRKSKLSICTR